MQAINWKELPEVGGVVALGSFDGVHLGHKKLLEFARARGMLTVITFSPHPRHFFGIAKENFLLTLDDEKEEILLQNGAQEVIFVKFDREFSSLSPEEFVRKVIKERLKPEVVVVGFDYHFGKNSSGHADDLSRLCKNYGIDVYVFPEVMMDGKPVKSTLIRGLLKEGNVELASRYLGRPYSFRGRVIKGEGIGSRIGFPTSNLDVHPMKVLPANGVYSTHVVFKGGIYPGMLYIGDRPTLGGEKRVVEEHIIGFDDEIYGQELLVKVYHRLRDEVKFENIEELKENLKMDMEKTIKKMKEVRHGA